MLMGWSSFLMAYEPTGVLVHWFQCQAAPWPVPTRACGAHRVRSPCPPCCNPIPEIQQTRKMDGFIDLWWSMDACFFSKFRDTINGLSWFFWYNPIKGRYTWSVSSNSVYTVNSVIICYLSPFAFEPEKSVDGSRMGRIVSLYGILYIL